jgi:hypothetical protein
MFCLIFAASVLLLVETSGANVHAILRVKEASKSAEDLLRELGLRHPTALGGYQSLKVWAMRPTITSFRK